MKSVGNFVFCLVILVFAIGVGSSAAAVEPVTYGDLMIEDMPHELAGRNELQLLTGYDVTNPYLNTYSGTLAYLQDVNPLFDAGIEVNLYSATRSRYNDRLTRELDVFGISAMDDRPRGSVFAIGKLKLLQGRVNLLGYRALPFRFNLKAGAGEMWHMEGASVNCATWGMESQLFVSARWGLALRFDQDLEKFWTHGQTVYRNRLSVGAQYIF